MHSRLPLKAKVQHDPNNSHPCYPDREEVLAPQTDGHDEETQIEDEHQRKDRKQRGVAVYELT